MKCGAVKIRISKNKKSKNVKFVVIAFVFSLTVLAFFLLLDSRLKPVVETMLKNEGITLMNREINSTVLEVLSQFDISYDDIIVSKSNGNGDIVSYSVDSVLVNKLRSEIAVNLGKRLGSNTKFKLSIPLGSLSSSALFYGKGPKLPVSVSTSGAVSTDFKSEFFEAGINQTLHRITVEVKTKVSGILPLSDVNSELICSVAVAETVIVGDVPDAYTKITRLSEDDFISENDIDDIFDFGATIE